MSDEHGLWELQRSGGRIFEIHHDSLLQVGINSYYIQGYQTAYITIYFVF